MRLLVLRRCHVESRISDPLRSLAHLEAATIAASDLVFMMEVQIRWERHTEGDSPLGSSPLKLHRRSSDKTGCSIRTKRRSASTVIRRRLLMINHHHMYRAYLFLALCLIEVVLLYAILCVSIDMLRIAGVDHLTHSV